MDLHRLTAHELSDRLKKKEATPEDIFSSLQKRLAETEGKVKAFVRLADGRLGQIRRTPPQLHGRNAGLLSGIPVCIKDNICTEGLATECCSRILAGFKPPYDATVIRRLHEAGALVLDAKTNMDEFAFGSSTENSCFGPTHNPWDLDRVPGGSSGGSAAAVAADETILAVGSDTGGSIRQPASFCGVVGMKPTYGRVSRYGLIAFASSLDQIGPFAKDVHDCALLLEAIAGHDPMDSTSADIPVPDYTKSLGKDIKNIRIGIPREYFVEGMDPEVKTIVTEAIEKLKSLGASTHEVTLAHTQYAVPVYYIVATAEASSNLARFDGVQYGLRVKASRMIDMYKRTRGEGFGAEAKRRILLGTFALSHGYYDAYYLRALKVRTLIKNDFDKIFKQFDCIVTPTSPTPAFTIGERAQDPLQMYLSDIYTISANLAGIPGISVPCGFTKKKLPVGLQILGKPFDEETLIRTAHAYEQKTRWNKTRPSL
ncbi:MAG: Asp-tRNA(Asn)/Glu-tRNA(Gln) amidotransferase subunit GatA [Candidatus Omnitrophica bacterium]|nr:Asp-tRNA(Asn)/Glu-tRNA(Gln) amidotransferase subunit GatA [Candidatus Omnitrophota bacterium]